jgi:hypothetical protein
MDFVEERLRILELEKCLTGYVFYRDGHFYSKNIKNGRINQQIAKFAFFLPLLFHQWQVSPK